MSEQLTLGDLAASLANSSAPEKTKRSAVKTNAELAIEARINALIEQKNKSEILHRANADLKIGTKSETEIETKKETEGKREVEISPPARVQTITKTVEHQTTSFEKSGNVKITSEEAITSVEVKIESEPVGQRDQGDEEERQERRERQERVEPEVLTVTTLNRAIKGMLEKSFSFLWVKGEISNLKVPGSGHLYFTLKDSGAQVKAIMFRGFAQGLKFRPEDGMEVLVRCKVTVYEPRGDYQLFCEVMEPVGFGALQVAFEKLKAKLQGEGLFEASRKRAIPSFPTRIAIVTSPTGAAIKDMLNVLGRRFGGGIDITIFPTNVQGDKAPGEIARAVDLVSKMGLARFDVMIVGRGGGSLEDLWAFNMEEVARAVSRCSVPTISAVGHEVDFTICDFVADLRAPTPSAAAELVVKNKADLVERITIFQRHLVQQMQRRIQLARARAEGSSKRLIDPKRKLQDLMLRSDEWSDRLTQAMQRYFTDSQTQIRFLKERLGSPQRKITLAQQKLQSSEARLRLVVQNNLEKQKAHFGGMISLLNGLSPLAILGRGYAIVKKAGQIIKRADELKPGDEIQVQLHEGSVNSKVL